MINYRIITLEQCLACYMAMFNKKSMSYEEINHWSKFLEKHLSSGKRQVIVGYDQEYIDELKQDTEISLFKINKNSISLCKGKTETDLYEQILASMNDDVLRAILKVYVKYLPLKHYKEGDLVE